MVGSPVGWWGRRSATSPYQPEGEPLLLNAAPLSQIPKQIGGSALSRLAEVRSVPRWGGPKRARSPLRLRGLLRSLDVLFDPLDHHVVVTGDGLPGGAEVSRAGA